VAPSDLPTLIFGVDLGFYMFRLPWYEFLQGSLVFMTVVAIVAVACAIRNFGLLRLPAAERSRREPAVRHLSILLFILAGALGWGYYLDRFDLLYSTTGVVYGVGYTAEHVTLPALWVMIGVSAAACALLVFNFFRPRWKAMAIGAVAFAALYIIGVLLIPALFQKFVVQPNELEPRNSLFEELHRVHAKSVQLDAFRKRHIPR
jgi:uncharacterized membrane protein (UPF0182 family)